MEGNSMVCSLELRVNLALHRRATGTNWWKLLLKPEYGRGKK